MSNIPGIFFVLQTDAQIVRVHTQSPSADRPLPTFQTIITIIITIIIIIIITDSFGLEARNFSI